MDIQKATKKINQITTDEDLRQDLWVAYLSGVPLSQLSNNILNKLLTDEINSQDKAALELIYSHIPLKLLNILTNDEKHVLFLRYLGYNIGEISVKLGKSRVAILNLLSSIKKNKRLGLYYGTQKIIYRQGKVRSN